VVKSVDTRHLKCLARKGIPVRFRARAPFDDPPPRALRARGLNGTENIAADIARISAALITALGEAKAMADAGQLDADFTELVRHARELGELLTEALADQGDSIGEYVRGVAASLTGAIERLEELVHQPGPTH
jgi:hypothetical protein